MEKKGLLVVTRMPGEAIEVVTPQGEKIEILIVSHHGARIRVGIRADRSFKITRTDGLSTEKVDTLPMEPLFT